MFTTAHEIPLSEWHRRLVAYKCTTISARFWPTHDPCATEYRCTVGCFLTQPTYLVRYTSQDRKTLVNIDAPDALPVTVAEFVKNPGFVSSVQTGWHPSGALHSAQLLVQHCETCKRRMVIDGVHRLVWMASRQVLDGDLYVSELSGPRWPADMPDMRTICECLNGGR
jgi:hypothetical protein